MAHGVARVHNQVGFALKVDVRKATRLTHCRRSARAQQICCIESERTNRRMMRRDISFATVAATAMSA